jgi:hypothetical protein
LLWFRRGLSITSILNVGYRLPKRQRDYQKAGLSLEGRKSDEQCGVTNLAFSYGGVLTKAWNSRLKIVISLPFG